MDNNEEYRKKINTLHHEMQEVGARGNTIRSSLTSTQTLEKQPFPDLSGGDPNATRGGTLRENRAAHLSELRHLYPIPGALPELVKETMHEVPMRDGHNIPVRIYVPTTQPSAGSAVVVMFHEGGWAMGDLSDEDQNCRLFSRDLGAVCVNVDYRLAPEHPFPKSVEDAYDVIEWCAATASSDSPILPGDPKQGFVVGGASAGGNLSAIVCQLGRDNGLDPPLTGQYLCVPALLWPDAVPEKWKPEYRSRYESTSDPVLKFDDKSAEGLMKALKPDTKSPIFSPLIHPNLQGLPPAFFQLGGLDPLRDEGLLYERVLREENNIPTKVSPFDRPYHRFMT